MSVLTIRLTDETHERLRSLAAYRKISMNKLIEEVIVRVMAEFDSEMRFRTSAAAGNTDEGLRILDKLDQFNLSKELKA